MWKLINIQAKNLCAFKELGFTVPQSVTTLVFGNNMDNDSQGSNGSGKSALIEAIAIALTGEPLRKVKVDEIINDSADEAIISAVLSNSIMGVQMTINRRLSRKQPQLVQVIEQTGHYDTDTEEIKQASVADYNKYILERIGLTKDDIYSNFILCRNKYKSFLSSNDKEKKEWLMQFMIMVILFFFATYRLSETKQPIVYSDEFGYWANSLLLDRAGLVSGGKEY